jgi:hypothetical protein
MKAIKLILPAALIVLNQFAFSQSWSLAGNNLAGTEKLGSTNNTALNFITNNKTRMSLTGAGNLKISSDQSSIQFPNTTVSNKPMILMFSSGTANPDRMVIAHSTPYTDYGLRYNDFNDRFDFIGASNMPLSVGLGSGKIGIGLSSPAVDLHVLHGDGDGTNHGLRLQNSGTNGNQWTLFTTNTSGSLQLWANGIFAGYFEKNSGDYNSTSDARRKKDIEAAQDVLQKVMQLDIKTYRFLENKPTDKKHYGMIAQEVEKIFPEVVSPDKKNGGDKDYYTMNYSAFGVLAIKAIQEQQKKIEEQEKTNQEQQQKITVLENQIAEQQKIINDLKSSIDQIRQSTSSSSQSSSLITKFSELSGARLIQNAPNPFRESTSINYYLPQNKNNATIEIVSANGPLIKSIPLTQKGNGQITINRGELSAGTYFYTLKIDGVKIDSKQMVMMK